MCLKMEKRCVHAPLLFCGYMVLMPGQRRPLVLKIFVRYNLEVDKLIRHWILFSNYPGRNFAKMKLGFLHLKMLHAVLKPMGQISETSSANVNPQHAI